MLYVSEPEFESESSESGSESSGSRSESDESGMVILRIRPNTLPAVCTDKYAGVILCDKSHLRALREWYKHFEIKLKLCSIHYQCDGVPCKELLHADTIMIERDCCIEVLSRVVDVIKWYDSNIIDSIKKAILSLIRSQLEANSGRDPEEIQDILDDINLDRPPTALFWARFRNLGQRS